MKKITINYVLWFFSRYNKKLYVDYDVLFDILYFYNTELKKVINFLEELEKNFDTDYIYKWYFKDFFSYKYYGSPTGSFNLTEFLQYAVSEYNDFIEDIKNEIF